MFFPLNPFYFLRIWIANVDNQILFLAEAISWVLVG